MFFKHSFLFSRYFSKSSGFSFLLYLKYKTNIYKVKQLRIEVYVQDGCPVCDIIKKDFNIDNKQLSVLEGITVHKIYADKKTELIDVVPTTLIISRDENNTDKVEYKESGVVYLPYIIKYIKVIKEGGRLATNL